MKSATSWFVIRFVGLVLLSGVFFLGFYAISRQVAPDPIVFYSGLRSIAYSAMAFFGLLWLLRRIFPGRLAWIDLQLGLPVAVIYVFMGYSFVITIPTLLDRSISIHVISMVAQSDARGMSKAELQDGFLRDYVEGTATIEKRLHEQAVSRNIIEDAGRYRITDRGRFVYQVNRFMARLFRVQTKYTEPPGL